MSEPSVAVIVPSYRRPQALARCLEALSVQTVPPARIVVAVREGDDPTQVVVRCFQRELDHLEAASVEVPGVAAAIQAAAARCTEEVVAHTDDDAVPRRDWIERMLALYSDDVGAVGGRDVIHDTTAPQSGFEDAAQLKRTVGQITWFGRVIGNHHLGAGPVRDVHILKGANMSMRRELWTIDSVLKGGGAQVAWEMGACLRVLRGGWRVIYDPGLAVDHYPAARFDEDQRGRPRVRAQLHAQWNQCYLLARYAPAWRVGQSLMYQLAVGAGVSPGLLRVLAASSRRFRAEPGWRRAALRLVGVRMHASICGLASRDTHRNVCVLIAGALASAAGDRLVGPPHDCERSRSGAAAGNDRGGLGAHGVNEASAGTRPGRGRRA